MPHLRQRHLHALLKKSLGFSPIVGIFGHRQVGKTTLLSIMAKRYQTLDEESALTYALDNPKDFLSSNQAFPLGIDECQLAPPLFPALKEWVRIKPTPGQFLLTGSVRFSSRKAIRESLTGRIIAWELLPMNLSEVFEMGLPDAIPRFLRSKTVKLDLKIFNPFSIGAMNTAIEKGGLPGIFAIRDASIRAQRFETQLNTLLERDLKLLLQTTLSYRTLRSLAVQLALSQGEPLEWAKLSRQTRVSVPTLRKLINALESIFFIRLLPTEGSEKKPVIFLEDQGEATYLAGGRYGEYFNLTRFLFSELRTQTHYRPELGIRIFQYRNRGGANIPLCFAQANSYLGIIPSLTENPSTGSLMTARSFLKKYKNAKVLLVHTGTMDTLFAPQIRSLGVAKLLSEAPKL